MRVDIYAARTQAARDSIRESVQKLSLNPSFEDVAALMEQVGNKDKDLEVLLEREALAVIVARLVDAVEGKKAKAKAQ